MKIGNSLTDPLTCHGDHGLFPVGGENIWFTPMFFRDEWQYRRLWAQIDMILSPAAKTPDAAPAGAATPGIAISTPPTIEPPGLQVNKAGQFTLF